jgi:iron complex outermembrane receptor protein
VLALYAQDVVRLPAELKLTLGARQEWFTTTDGEQRAAGRVVPYPERRLQGFSPKATLSWTATEALLLEASYGRGVRFPNVEELYNGTVTATSVTLSDPNLRPERANAVDVSAETVFGRQTLRASVFHDEVYDAIMRQSNQTVVPTVTNVSNVDHVRTSGFELVWSARDVGIRGLSLEANGAVTRSKVVENAKDPLTEGKYFLRVPKTRGSLLAAYRPTAQWMGSVGFRHCGAAYNDVYNLDINRNTYGGLSTLNQLDLRLTYKPVPKVEASIGMDNVTDQRAYQSHPFPSRTLLIELRTSSR